MSSTYTTNLGLRKPAHQDPDTYETWDQVLNNNFDTIDAVFGARSYTEKNYILNSDSHSQSLDKLDIALKDVSGVAGISGFSGYSGSLGLDGAIGVSGFSGYSGAIGAGSVREVHFAVPNLLAVGDQAPWIHMAFAGAITSVYALVKTRSTSGAIVISIQKCTDMTQATLTWGSIFSTDITIDVNKRSTINSAVPAVFNGSQVFNTNDVFRIVVSSKGTNSADLVVSAKIVPS